MLLQGDIIKLVHPINGFDRVGDIYEVVDILDGGMISFRCGYGAGVMSYDEFETYFEKKIIRTWSQWENIRFENDDIVYSYRTNGKRIELRHGNLKASASCYESDDLI